MHYIIGTSLRISRHINSWDSMFKLNEPYTIIGITSIENGLKYKFGSRSGSTEIVFESARQADRFIASHRREQIPNYESIYERNTAL